MSAQHTPGTWSDGLHHQGHLAVQSDNGRLVAFCGAIARDDEQLENLANARLIAAAPDLLAAAQCALADFEGILPEFDPEQEYPAWETLAELRAAITKATGEAA
jgi:hypothetical protein